MRTFTRNILVVLASITGCVAPFTACSADCEEKGTCGPYSETGGTAGEAGSATGGSSASGGSSGTSGTSGSSGTSGTTGTSGDGAGAQAGEAGRGGGSGGASAQGGASAGGSAGDTGITGGEGGEAGGGTPCDPLLSPGEDACVIDDVYAVFVSPTGSDDEGDGTKASPFESFAKAIESAALNDKRVFACADGGVFGERVSIDAEANGVEIYGGFSCDDWTYDATAKTSVVSPTPLALHIVDAEDVTIEGFRFEAADGSLPGESSVGAFVVNSTGVVLRRVEIVAGDGVKGADGGLVGFDPPSQEELNGYSEAMGGGQKICACQGTLMSAGGAGGPPAIGGQPGSFGFPDHDGDGDRGHGGTPNTCGSGGSGDDGADAPPVSAASGATDLGSVSSAGWQPAAGYDGATGQPGQGGGGGASRNENGHGGGGGCGGCGGTGATKAFGGGGSIGLLAVDSDVTLVAAGLTTNVAGDGGNGSAGEPAQEEFGFGGIVDIGVDSCVGGAGGLGANGGASGGGAGGISVGIVWTGDEEPGQTDVTFELGTAGDGGIGGEPGVNDGIDGLARDTYEVP
jgi:hypothetical protein